jgi:nicotinamide-nucleotide amidase
VETEISDLIEAQSNPTIATYAKTGEVHLRVTAKASDEKEAYALIDPVVKELKKRFGSYIYTTKEQETLEESILKLLKEKEMTLTTAESCTGGMIAARFTDVPGASEVFKQGLVTYSNRAKRKLLDVKKSTLKEYGAVSEKTARAMAKNGAFITGSDVCIAVTGIAGPGKGEEEKPVGLVYIACCCRENTVVEEYHFKGERRKIRENAVVKALTLLRKCILEDTE